MDEYGRDADRWIDRWVCWEENVMAKGTDWSDYFADSFTKASDRAAQIAYEREKFKQENDPEVLKNKMIAQMQAYRMAMGEAPIDVTGSSGTPTEAQVRPDPLGQREAYTNGLPIAGMGNSITGGTPKTTMNKGGVSLSFGGAGKADPIQEAYEKANVGVLEDAAKKTQENQLKVNESALTSQYNLNLSAESLADYSKLLAKSWTEGGAGNLMKGLKTDAAMQGVPIGDASQYQSSGALSGKLVEIVSKTFPMLTQQIGKEGSVRLIESVFSKLGASYPNAKTPPELAPEQIKQSLLSMYRINRAMQNLNVKDFDLKKKSGEDAFRKRVLEEVKNIDLSEEDQKAFDALSNKVLAPVNARLELIRRQKMKKGKK